MQWVSRAVELEILRKLELQVKGWISMIYLDKYIYLLRLVYIWVDWLFLHFLLLLKFLEQSAFLVDLLLKVVWKVLIAL